LLLLDYWPLGRLNQRSQFFKLLKEKVPFLALSAISCAITFLVPEKLPDARRLPLWLRIQNAIVSCCIYLRQTIWPAGLAAYYPNPTQAFSFWELAGSLALICFVSAAAFGLRKRYPYLLVGWLWFVGMLAPVIGLVQISSYAHADRYTYLPQIGLFLLATWAVADLSASWRHRGPLLGVAAGIILAGWILLARAQTAYWHDSETLWNHALAVTHWNGAAHNNLGYLLAKKGQTDAAIVQFQDALEDDPDKATGHCNLGTMLLQEGRTDAAIAQFNAALRLNPSYAKFHYSLGCALCGKGQVDAAILQFQKAVELRPGDAELTSALGSAYLQKGKARDAIFYFRKALENDAFYIPALNKLAWVLASCPDTSLRNEPEALELARKANELTGGQNPDVLRTLAAAYAGSRQYPAAIEAQRRALRLVTAQGNTGLAFALDREIRRYEADSHGATFPP